MRFSLLIFLLVCCIAKAGDSDRFVKSYVYSTNLCVVVTEGDFEWRSLGSYNIRLHELEDDKEQPAGEFYSGLVRPRDGTVEAVLFKDVDGDGKPDVVVTIRNVGTGQYLSSDAFVIRGKHLSLLAHVEDLGPDADCVAALKKQLKTDKAAKLKP